MAAGGDLTARYELALERVEHGNPPRFDVAFISADAEPRHVRRFTEFSGDVSGRYLDAMAAATRFAGLPAARWQPALDAVLKLQKPDGHFGATFEPGKATDMRMAMLWGNGRMLIGLLEAYEATHDARVLTAARKLGDFLLAEAPLMNSPATLKMFNDGKAAVGYICWTQNVEGLVRLHALTKDARYLALAREISERTQFRPAQHSHGHLASLRGIVMLYETTGEARYLKQVEEQYQAVIDTGNRLPEGAVPELYIPQMRRDEGCSEADWLRLSLALYRVTRKPAYLDEAERTLFNELAFNQFSNGDFGHRSRTEADVAPRPGFVSIGGAAHAWWCCLFHGLRALEEVLGGVFVEQQGATAFVLPVDGHAKSAGVEWVSESSLEQNGRILIRAATADGRKSALRVRVPGWAHVTANAASTNEPGWLVIDRAWKKGDTVELRYEMATRVEQYQPPEPFRALAGNVLIWHGPWLLAADSASSPNFFDEPHVQNQIELPTTGKWTAVAEAPAPFTVPVAHFEIGYLPGGYPVQPQKARLRPLAEQTSHATSAWAFLFKPAKAQR
jgi:DUF1680 family protein